MENDGRPTQEASVKEAGGDGGERLGYKIVLWGPTAAGKTMFLAKLFLFPSLSDGWSVRAAKKSLTFLAEMRRTIVDRNRFPPPTAARDTEEIVFHFKDPSGHRAQLVVEDRPGRDYTDESSDDTSNSVRSRLANADGFILLFDPQRNVQKLESDINRMLSEVYIPGGVTDTDPRPFAICLTKSDMLMRSVSEVRRATRDPERYVLTEVEPRLLEWVKQYCSTVRLFPISSVGVSLQYGALEPVVFYDEALELRVRAIGRPFNLIEPFAWILTQLEGEL